MNKYKVLVLEDDPDMAAMLKITLPQYEVITCTEKAHAVNKAKKHLLEHGAPDVFLIDLIINGEGGLDFYQWVCEHKFYAPVIFLTGCHPHSPEFVSALETGEIVYEKDQFSSKTLARYISELVLEKAS